MYQLRVMSYELRVNVEAQCAASLRLGRLVGMGWGIKNFAMSEKSGIFAFCYY